MTAKASLLRLSSYLIAERPASAVEQRRPSSIQVIR
jgi:hypothetical protein